MRSVDHPSGHTINPFPPLNAQKQSQQLNAIKRMKVNKGLDECGLVAVLLAFCS